MIAIIIICSSFFVAFLGIKYIERKTKLIKEGLKNTMKVLKNSPYKKKYDYEFLCKKLSYVRSNGHILMYSYDYSNGYLKLFLGGGSGFKIKCLEQDVELLLAPIKEIFKTEEINVDDVDIFTIIQCKKDNWETWDCYEEK